MNSQVLHILLLLLLLPAPLCALQSVLEPGGYYIGQAPPGSRVFYQDRQLPLTPDNQFLLGFGRDADLQQHLTLRDKQGHETVRNLQLRPRRYKIQRIDGISRKLMEPTAANLVRIAAEAQQTEAARQILSRQTAFEQPFIWPLKGRISGVYGSRRILNGEPRSPHFGLDIAAPQGTPVVAPAGGMVRLAHPGMFFSGKTLIIDHGFGLSSSFLHLSRILVKEGQTVRQGEKIALVGASGRVTGPHLDWRINWLDERLDPALWVPETENNRTGKD